MKQLCQFSYTQISDKLWRQMLGSWKCINKYKFFSMQIKVCLHGFTVDLQCFSRALCFQERGKKKRKEISLALLFFFYARTSKSFLCIMTVVTCVTGINPSWPQSTKNRIIFLIRHLTFTRLEYRALHYNVNNYPWPGNILRPVWL